MGLQKEQYEATQETEDPAEDSEAGEAGTGGSPGATSVLNLAYPDQVRVTGCATKAHRPFITIL
jgi:hypothetical protein